VSLTTLAGSWPWDVGYCASTIGIFAAQTWHFRGRNGYLLLNTLHVKLVTWRAGGHLGVRFLLRASRVIQQCAVTSHSQNTVWRSSALNAVTQSEHQKMFQGTRSSYGACEAVRSVWNMGHTGFTLRTSPNSRIKKKCILSYWK
jgi:hypothetical protein